MAFKKCKNQCDILEIILVQGYAKPSLFIEKSKY